MAMVRTTRSTPSLPVPREQLLEIGLTDEQIDEALAAAPLTMACQAADQPGAWFDVDRVKKALKALSAFRHTKGRWAGVRMALGEGLDPWQVVWVIAPIFGWVYLDVELDEIVRVIRSAWIEVPRKNGKSTISSGVSSILLLADGEAGAEVYNAAGSKEQARRVFDDAKRMMLTSPAARRRTEPLTDVVRAPRSGGILRVLSRVSETAHGLNVSGAVIDEVHTLRLRRALVEAIETGTGARTQPLIVFITTADEDEEGTIYDEKHQLTVNLSKGIGSNPSHYGAIWAAADDEDPFSEETMAKANPGAGKSPTWKYLRDEALKAQQSPSYLPTYLRLSLNRRQRDTALFIDMAKWDGPCAGMLSRARMQGRRAWSGLDLSAVSDFSAWAVWSESEDPRYELDLLTRFWIPEERVDDLEKKLQVPLRSWVQQGWVTATEGDAIDYSAIEQTIVGDCRHFQMQRVSYDRMFAGQLVQNLTKKLGGIELSPVPQTFLGLSPSTKELDRLVLTGGVNHGRNPVLRWMASVTEVKTDGLDNVRPVKPDRKKSSKRIDGIQAAVTGMDGRLRAEARGTGKESHAVYSYA